MRRLYFRIYLAVLGSLVVFAASAALFWHFFVDFERFGPRPEFYLEAAERLVPPADASREVQSAALEQWRARSGYDLALFTADGRVVADASDSSLPPPRRGERVESYRWRGPSWAHGVQLRDGRWLVVGRPRSERSVFGRLGWLAALAGMALVVGLCAYPVVRRLTRGLEGLQTSVEALGAGHFSARFPVEGKDEVARLAQAFNVAAARIQTLVEANRSLLANASHELRSPLARLKVAVAGIEGAAPAGVRAELGRNIDELDQLIGEILLASRLDAQTGDRATFEPVDIVALAAEECARSGGNLGAVEPGLPLIDGDARLLRRLIRNLLENAHRYAPGVAADVLIHMGAPGHLEIDVCDRGPGVPEAERTRIFDPFYRLAGARERDGGVGLGLSLVRQIAERHDGGVVCLPRNGGGSCFRVAISLASRENEGDIGRA